MRAGLKQLEVTSLQAKLTSWAGQRNVAKGKLKASMRVDRNPKKSKLHSDNAGLKLMNHWCERGE